MADVKEIIESVLGSHHPYICVHTTTKGNCVRYKWDETTKRYDDPPLGEPCPCGECKYYASKAQMLELKAKGLIESIPSDIQ